MPTPVPQDPPTPTQPHSPFRVVPAQSHRDGPYDMWAVEHNGITLARWNQLDQAHTDANDRYQRWIAEGQPDPTPPHPSVTELTNVLDAARQAFENATPNPTAIVRLLETIRDLGAPHGTHVDSATNWVRELVADRDELAKMVIRRGRENNQLTAELAKAKAELATLAAVKPTTEVAVLPDNWRDQLYDILQRVWNAAMDTCSSPDFRGADGEEAYLTYQRNIFAEATSALRSGSNALNNAATRMENRRRELVALLRDHPGGGLVNEPANWEDTLDVVRAHLVHRKLDRDYRTSLVQALRRWLTAGKPVADWQMVHLVDQLSDQVGKWFDAATEKGETQMLGHAEVLDALKPRKGPGGDG